MRKFFIYHLPALIYAALIITLSSIQNLSVGSLRVLFFDKIVHFIEYSIFAFFIFRSFSNMSKRIDLNKSLLLSALVVCLFAWGDETFQRFVPGRHFDIYDLLTDVFGALLVIFYLWFRQKKLKENKA